MSTFLRYTVRDTVREVKKDGREQMLSPVLMLEPVVGVEPTTCCLRNSCSATELHRQHIRYCSIASLCTQLTIGRRVINKKLTSP